jgi:hypothetical protein
VQVWFKSKDNKETSKGWVTYIKAEPHTATSVGWKPANGMIGEVMYSKICDEYYDDMCNKYVLQVHGHLVVLGEDALEPCSSIAGTHPLYSPTVLTHCTHPLYSPTVLTHCTHPTVLILYAVDGSSIAYQNETMGTFVLQAGESGGRSFFKSETDYLYYHADFHVWSIGDTLGRCGASCVTTSTVYLLAHAPQAQSIYSHQTHIHSLAHAPQAPTTSTPSVHNALVCARTHLHFVVIVCTHQFMPPTLLQCQGPHVCPRP